MNSKSTTNINVDTISHIMSNNIDNITINDESVIRKESITKKESVNNDESILDGIR